MRTPRKISDLIQSFNQEDLGIVNTIMKSTKTAICLTIATVMWGSVVSAEYYRWKDSSGGTQYGDQVPAKDASHGRVKVDEKKGLIVEKILPARSPEEQRQFEEEQRKAEIEQKRKEEQDAYDRVLLATFNSAEEIINVRDERIDLIEQSITLSRSRLRKQEMELVKLNESRSRFIERDMEPPEWLDNTEMKVLSRIAGIEQYISDKGLEKERLRRQFGEDLKRYKELTKRSLSAR